MPPSPASVRTTPAADLATSVAVETAMPICAWRSAGASFAPSPHIPTVCPLFWNALTRSNLPWGKHTRKDREVFRFNAVWQFAGRTDCSLQSNRLSDDCGCGRSVSCHHDSAHAETVQLRDKKDRVGPRQIAEGNQSNDLVGCRRSRGNCQNSKALLLEFVDDSGRGGRWRSEGGNRSERALDDSLGTTFRICRGCFRGFLNRIERNKNGQLWQVGGCLLRCGKPNGRIDRVLAPFRTRQRRHPEDVCFVESGQ